MQIFISWSGEKSKIVAEGLRDWIPYIIQSAKPWVSSKDISAGDRWSKEIADKLENTKFGIICLTPENMDEPWIHFEAGALAKTLNETYVCPYLINLSPSDIEGPLTQFQLMEATKSDTLNIILTINRALDDEALNDEQIKKTFYRWWPDLEEKLKKLPSSDGERIPKRVDREILEEILNLVRGLARFEKKVIVVEDQNFSDKKTLPPLPPLKLPNILESNKLRRRHPKKLEQNDVENEDD